MRKNLFKMFIFVLCLSAFLGILVLITGTDNEILNRILQYTLLFFGHCLLIVGVFGPLYSREKYKPFSAFGITISLGLYIYNIYFLNLDIGVFSEEFGEILKTYFSILFLLIALIYIGILLLVKNRHTAIIELKRISIIIAIVIYIIQMYLMWQVDFLEFSSIFTILGILYILITLFSILIPVLSIMYKGNKEIEDPVQMDNGKNQDVIQTNNNPSIENNIIGKTEITNEGLINENKIETLNNTNGNTSEIIGNVTENNNLPIENNIGNITETIGNTTENKTSEENFNK